jgi:ABC-type antimicrobial peptide transport system permease subunit
MARRLWPNQDAIGKVLTQDRTRPLTVIGVARDAKYRSLGDEARMFLYVPLQQQYIPRVTIVARSANGQRHAAEIRALVASMNANLPIVTAQTLDEFTKFGLVPQRVAASMSGGLGIVGLLLAGMGIYGVTAYMVTSRTREIGIRVALGADRRDVLGMVLRRGMLLVGIGVAAGTLLAAAASRVLGSLLFGLPPTDPVTFSAAIALFCAIGLAACYVPARRATEIEPTLALRSE